MAVDHLDAAMRRTFGRNGELERLLRDSNRRQRRPRNCDKCVQEDGPIVIVGRDGQVVTRIRRMLVRAPMGVHRATAVMRRRVIVGMRVEQRRRQGSPLDGQRQRHGDQLSQDTFIVRGLWSSRQAHPSRGVLARRLNHGREIDRYLERLRA